MVQSKGTGTNGMFWGKDGKAGVVLQEGFMSTTEGVMFAGFGLAEVFPAVLVGHELFHCGQRRR